MLEILAIIENFSSSPELHAEHGLSLYIRQNDEYYLLDTGASSKFLDNAQKMGVDLKTLNGVIISHNHYDHTGGLPALLEFNKEVKVYMKNFAKSEFYYKVLFFKKNVGEKKGLFETYADRFVFIDEDLRLSKSIELMSNNVYDHAYYCKDTNLLEKKNGKFVPDEFNHELFIVLEENEKLIIVSSCSHNGIVNIVNTVKRKYPNKLISHIIGGFHFALIGMGSKPSKLNCTEGYIKEVAQILKRSCNEIYTCHCTGKTAYDIMKKEIGDSVTYFDAGKKIVIN